MAKEEGFDCAVCWDTGLWDSGVHSNAGWVIVKGECECATTKIAVYRAWWPPLMFVADED